MKEMRSCIICRKKKNKQELIRIVSLNGEAKVDKNHTISSRGMYICNDEKCLLKIKQAKSLDKIIKINSTEDKLRKVVDEILGEKQVGKN